MKEGEQSIPVCVRVPHIPGNDAGVASVRNRRTPLFLTERFLLPKTRRVKLVRIRRLSI